MADLQRFQSSSQKGFKNLKVKSFIFMTWSSAESNSVMETTPESLIISLKYGQKAAEIAPQRKTVLRSFGLSIFYFPEELQW
jgi:hypothetical protein